MVMAGGAAVLSSSRLLVAPPQNSNSPPKILNPHHLPPLLSLTPRARVPHLSTNFNLDRSTLTTLSLRSKWRLQDSWEDPDDGYGSEFDEEDDEDDEEEEANNNASNAKTASASASEYDELVKEVEMLLHPEERAILQENETPALTKISTDGFTALHKAVIGKKEAVISHLLRKGANPHVRDRDGATPLHYAVQVSAMQTVKLLIKYKVDVNVADKDGWTPLHVAMQSRSRDIAKVLLINGADKTRKNKDGMTPLDISLCYGKDFKSYELAKLLKLVPANRYL